VSPYWKLSGFMKRVNGVITYLFCAVACLYDPVAVDAVMFKTLLEQFEGMPNDNAR
jgi:hypothetical protein